MKRLLLLLALLWASPCFAQGTIVGPSNAILCNQFAMASPVAAGTISLVAGVAGKSVFICGWHVTSTQTGGTNTFQLEYGTQGGPCTSPTALTPAFNISNTAPSADHIDYASIQTTAGAQLCVVSSGTTVGTAIGVWYAQF
jgi:hypothetical protein